MAPKFSLQSVLDYRHSKVEALEIEFSELLAEEFRARTRESELTENLTRMFEQLNVLQMGEMDLFAISCIRADINKANQMILEIVNYLADLDIRIESKRQEIVFAKQDEEILGTLKNKEIDRWNVEVKERELREQDDIYIAQAFRSRAAQVAHHG